MKGFPTGVATGIEQYSFSSKERKAILEIFPGATTDLVLSLENAITTFNQLDQIRNSTSNPKDNKQTIRKILSSCTVLSKALSETDGFTQNILRFSDEDQHLLCLLESLKNRSKVALKQLEGGSSLGRLEDFASAQLACDVANAIEKSGHKVSLTHTVETGEGLYAQVLRFCVNICAGKAPSDMLALMRKGRALQKTTSQKKGHVVTEHF